MRPADKSKCIHVLLSLVELKERTQCPLGIIYVCSREGSVEVLYLGVPSAKLVLLVRQMPQSEVNVWVAGASAYVTGMNTTASVRMLRPFVAQQMSHLVGTGDVSVEMQSGCSRISLLGHQCTTYHCPFCILVQIGLSVVCPGILASPLILRNVSTSLGKRRHLVKVLLSLVTLDVFADGSLSFCFMSLMGWVILIQCKVFLNGSIMPSSTGCCPYYLTPILSWASLEPSLLPLSRMVCPTAITKTFLSCPVTGTPASVPYSMSGVFVYVMMAELGSLGPHVIRALKKVFK